MQAVICHASFSAHHKGVPVRAIAEVIGRHLRVPVVAIAPEDAGVHFSAC